MIVVLNGPSSAGKTTLAHAVRKSIGATVAAVSIDRFFAFLHPDIGVHWPEFDTITEATFAAACVFADRGLDVIVDTVFERAASLDTARRVLGERRHALVAVTCSVETLEARERERGNRPVGLARGQHGRVLHDAVYELSVDSDRPLEDYVGRVAALLRRCS